jgi:hypothetical protein
MVDKKGIWAYTAEGVIKAMDRIDFSRPKSSSIADEINTIFETVETKQSSLEGTNFVFDPRKDYEEAIRLAKRTRDRELVAKIYERIISTHEQRGYNYDAADIAIEFGQKERALRLIDLLIHPLKSPMYDEALTLAKKLGKRYVKEIKKDIERKKEEVDIQAKEQFSRNQELSELCYVTKSGARHQINQDGFLFRNSEPFVLVGRTFQYIGVADKTKTYNEMVESIGYGSRFWNSNRLQSFHRWNQESPFVKKVDFEDVKNHLGQNYSLVGEDREQKELLLTSPIVKIEK